MSTVSLTLDEIFDLAKKSLLANGCDDETASILSDLIRNAERDGSLSHGLFRLPAYVSGFFGIVFLREKFSRNQMISVIFVILALVYLLIKLGEIPWIGITVAVTFSLYGLIRKKVKVSSDIGLLIESLYILPFALIVFYFIFDKGLNDFSLTNPSLSILLLLAGPMTVIPLFLYVRGVELIGLGATGMIFYITPTLQFILGYFYYNEDFSLIKLVSFIIIWIAVIIYLKDLYETN